MRTLHDSCREGNVEELNEFLNNPDIDLNDVDEYGQTPFFIACENGHKEVVELLMNDERIDVNKTNNIDSTPFSIACAKEHKEIVELFIKDERIDVNKVNKYGWTPFSLSCANGHKEMVELLMKDERIDVNKSDKNGQTPFYITCYYGHKEIVELLTKDKRIDVNKASIDGRTPFSAACENGNKEVVEPLMKDKRIDVTKANVNGRTPFELAFNSFLQENAPEDSESEDSENIEYQELLSFLIKSFLCTELKTENEINDLKKDDKIDLSKVLEKMQEKGWIGENFDITQMNDALKNFELNSKGILANVKDLIDEDIKAFEKDASAETFANMVLLSDEFVKIKDSQGNEEEQKAKRFLEIAKKIPLYAKMELANKTYGSTKKTISSEDVGEELKEALQELEKDLQKKTESRPGTSPSSTSFKRLENMKKISSALAI